MSYHNSPGFFYDVKESETEQWLLFEMGVQSTQFVEDALVLGYLIRHHVGHQNERSKAKQFPVFCPGVDVLLR